MAWSGWFSYGGTEVVNATRTEEYARELGWFKPVYRNEALPLIFGDGSYASPLQDDDVPWVDNNEPNSYRFYGAYPLDVSGIEDSTSSAEITESTLDGGIVGRSRRSTRTVVFTLALVGADECAVEYGMRWLRAVFGGDPCFGSDRNCNVGSDLCYLSCAPDLNWVAPGDPELCLPLYERSLHKVTTINGPIINSKHEMTDGGVAWVVTVTVVAGNPFEFGIERPLIIGFGDPAVDVPYVGGVVPPGGSFDPDGSVVHEVSCPVPTYQPVVDPLCPLVIAPPAVPGIALTCFDFPVNFVRRQFVVPPQSVPLWGDAVPVINIHARTGEVRSLRLRFYTDTFGTGETSGDPCNFCGDIVFSYVPAGATLVFDGTDQQVYVAVPGGGRRRADSLVYGSDGSPFEWPALSCGIGYVVTIDQPQTATSPVIDFALASRAA